MTMYLLLRNNKQSGPFTLEELKGMGLKAYDLVWSEGKSAAWRYPGELDELSAFAPPVEEQPFDRFYKKPYQANSASTTTLTAQTAANESAPVPVATPVTVESTKTPGKRIIYVTMPAGKSPVPVRDIPREAPAREAVPVRETAPAREVPNKESHASRVIEDYSAQAPLDDTSTVEFLPRHKAPKSSPLVKYLAVGACILALLAAGMFIGLSLNKSSLGFQQKIAKVPASEADQSTIHTTAQQLPAPAVNPLTSEKPKDSVDRIANQLPVTDPSLGKAVARNSASPAVRSSKERSGPGQSVPAPVVKDSAAAGGIPVVHREAEHRADPAEPRTNNGPDRESIRAALANQVSLGANGYTIGTFGGIANLQLTITNRSVYPLDLVVVEVQYIQANKKVYKTENLYFRGVASGGALMQEAPKSSRGIKVQYRIISISSKELGLSYSGI